MSSSVSGTGSQSYNNYRDYLGDYNRPSSTEETAKIEKQWNAVFEENKQAVSVDDFLTLMVAQLRNQDFMNPVDDTQFVTQLAQFATMQQMQDMAANMKSNYALSLVGQNVTAAKFTVGGALKKETGIVEKISLVDGSYEVTVNGEKFTLEQIMELNAAKGSSGDTSSSEDKGDQKAYLVSLVGKTVSVKPEGAEEEITGLVTRISTADGKYQLKIGDKWYSLDDVVGVGSKEPADTDTDTSEISEEEHQEKVEYLESLMDALIHVNHLGENGETETVEGRVTDVSYTKGSYQLKVHGEWFDLDDVVKVIEESSGESDDFVSGTDSNPENPGTETPGVSEPDSNPENPGIETPGVSEPDSNPENPGTETPGVSEPDSNPENPGTETPGVSEPDSNPENPGTETPGTSETDPNPEASQEA